MRIRLTSVFVGDQDKASSFTPKKLGFVKKQDFPVGEFKWLTVVSPDEPDGTELLLEPDTNPASQAFNKSVYEQGIPVTAFAVDDIHHEYELLKQLGVVFHTEPTQTGSVTVAVFDDTCGNLIQIYQA